MKPSLWVQMWIIWSLWLVQAEQVEFYFFSMELVISSPVCISKHCFVPIFIIIIFKKNWGKLLIPFWGPISDTVKLYLTFVADPLFLSCFPFKHEKTLSMKSSVSTPLAKLHLVWCSTILVLCFCTTWSWGLPLLLVSFLQYLFIQLYPELFPRSLSLLSEVTWSR